MTIPKIIAKIFGKLINSLYICENAWKMRIELDFDKKEIILKDNISISEVIEKMELLKIDDWKEWKIKAQEIIWQYWPYYPLTNPYPLGPTYVSIPSVWTEQTTTDPYIITCSQ